MKKIFTLALSSLLFTAQAQEKKTEYELVNLGKKLNTKYHESAPIISADGKTLYFFVADHPKNYLGKEGSQDIWYSQRDANGEWQEAKHMESPLNKHRYNQVMSVSPDGNTLMLRGGDKKDSKGFSLTTRTKNGWSKPNDIKVPGFEKMNKGIYYGGFLSGDGKVLMLYFSEKPKSRYSDLYVSMQNDKGEWSRPVKLPSNINTNMDEFGPFIASDNKTVYYASNRPSGKGGMDIYKIQRLDNEWLKWSNPENLGAPVNTSGFDAYYTVDASGINSYTTRAYMSPDGGSLDILGLRPKKVAPPVVKKEVVTTIALSGRVFNQKTMEPVEATIVYDADGKQEGETSSEAGSGNYKVVMPGKKKYTLTAIADGYLSLSDTIDLSNAGKIKDFKRDLYLVPIEVGAVVRLNNIFFDFDKSTLRPESFPELNRVVDLLQNNPGLQVEIGGHTDSHGSDEYNQRLSQGRANAVRMYLIEMGILAEKVLAKGYGESEPEVSNETDEGRQTNRRVEFKVLKFEEDVEDVEEEEAEEGTR